MSKQLIALAAIAALGVAAGDAFTAEDDAADGYIKDGQAKLAETEPPVQTSAPAKTAKLVKARVLTDCAFGKANDVVKVTSAEAKASPDLDPEPAAVAYAESLVKAAE